jgi:hypothetical protein
MRYRPSPVTGIPSRTMNSIQNAGWREYWQNAYGFGPTAVGARLHRRDLLSKQHSASIPCLLLILPRCGSFRFLS